MSKIAAGRRFKFHERGQLFIASHNKTLSVVTMRVGYAKFYSRSHDAVICVYDDAGNVIETHQQAGDFKGG